MHHSYIIAQALQSLSVLSLLPQHSTSATMQFNYTPGPVHRWVWTQNRWLIPDGATIVSGNFDGQYPMKRVVRGWNARLRQGGKWLPRQCVDIIIIKKLLNYVDGCNCYYGLIVWPHWIAEVEFSRHEIFDNIAIGPDKHGQQVMYHYRTLSQHSLKLQSPQPTPTKTSLKRTKTFCEPDSPDEELLLCQRFKRLRLCSMSGG